MTYKEYTEKKYNEIFAKQYMLVLEGRESETAKTTAERRAQHTAMLVTFEDAYEKYARIYQKCKGIVERIEGTSSIINQIADNLKRKFSSEYMTQQIELMVSMQATNPTNAIGTAKELIESCCKTILDEMGIPWSKTDDVPQLTNKTLDALNLLPSNIQSTDQGADVIKAILGNLRAIPSKLAEIRNPFGSGHGKSASFKGLEERHAKLAVGSSITFVDFVWSTYENQKQTGQKII